VKNQGNCGRFETIHATTSLISCSLIGVLAAGAPVGHAEVDAAADDGEAQRLIAHQAEVAPSTTGAAARPTHCPPAP
jgi:hypothetical protein